MSRICRVFVIAATALLFIPGLASAEICDLTTNGSTCDPTLFNGAIFQETSPQPTGTGYIDSFLRLQRNGTEEGYNTSARPFQYDQKEPINYTHDIQLQDVPIVTIDGVQYREFYLDINEAASDGKELLSLDELRIYLSDTGNLDNYNTKKETLNGLTAIYDLDAGLSGSQDNWVKLNYSLNSGSGSGDMVAYIPNYLFTGDSTDYVYLYSKFGLQSGMSADDGSDAGFEEWWLKKSPASPPSPAVPEPGTLLLLGSGLVIAARRKLSRPGNRR